MLSPNTIILGNGFDIDLGLETRYKDFLKSEQFLNSLKYYKDISKEYNLFRFIHGQSQLETWGGVEASLLDFVLSFRTPPNKDVRNIIREMHDNLEKCIAEYLRNISYANIKTDSCAAYLLHELNCAVNVYSFNYTDINKTFSTNYDFVNRIHGTLKDDNAILGVQDESIINGLGFVKKSHHSNYNSKKFVEDMLASEHILFFGHSMCMSDKEYFTSIFNSSTQNMCKQITFIVYDKDDVDIISENIERMSNLKMSVIKEHIPMEFHCTTDNENTKKAIDDFIIYSRNKNYVPMPKIRSIR